MKIKKKEKKKKKKKIKSKLKNKIMRIFKKIKIIQILIQLKKEKII